MSIPVPGKPVRGSESGAPIMAIFDLLGRRWAMGIIWNLSKGPSTFRGLQEQCKSISPSILNKRIKELREAKLLDRSLEGYILTPMGEQLYSLLEPFKDWSIQWANELSPDSNVDWEKVIKG